MFQYTDRFTDIHSVHSFHVETILLLVRAERSVEEKALMSIIKYNKDMFRNL